ncbi:MAG: hypothetical protein GX197_08400 [Firmicutes bacterium]|nr:hypothetical protein [Bacillota bacterium]
MKKKKTASAKNFMTSMKKNKAAVYILVFLIAGGLILSSLIAVFANPVANREEPLDYESQIAQINDLIAQYEEKLADTPEDVSLLTQLGYAYYNLGVLYTLTEEGEKATTSFINAMDTYGKALELEPENVNLHVDRAVAAYYAGEMELADTEFQQAIELDPEHAVARYQYGVFLYYGANKPEEALAQWEAVVALDNEENAELAEAARAWVSAVKDQLENADKENTVEED